MAFLPVETLNDKMYPDTSALDIIGIQSDTNLFSVSDTICAKLDSITSHILNIAAHTNPDPYTHWSIGIAILAFFISIISAIYTWKGASFSEKTAKNVERMAGETQMSLLEDIVRHLYRNKVCTHALITKMQDQKNKYPSEEHFLKLSMLPEDIHMESYNKDPRIYSKMHEISILLRNYNLEIEIIQKQLCNPGTSEEVRVHGKGTLVFKPYFLINKIAEVMDVIKKNDKKDQKEKVVEIILREHFSKLFDKYKDAKYIPLHESVEGSRDVSGDANLKNSLRDRYEKIKKEIIADGNNKRSLLNLTKKVTGGEISGEEINENSDIEAKKLIALKIRSKNVFDNALRKKYIETKKKENSLKVHLFNEIYLEDYTNLYLEEYKGDESYENIYQELHIQTNRRGKEQGADDFDLFNIEWDAFDMLHKALIKDVTIEYDVIRMIPYPEQ